MLKIALAKGRIENKIIETLAQSGIDVTPLIQKDRKLVITVGDFQFILTKAVDVLTYIEHGIVDVGILGSDVMMEHPFKSYYELLDLEFGRCNFALASYPDFEERREKKEGRLIVASKYVNVTREYFMQLHEDVEIIKLEGSVELAPLTNIADAIVDLVETGSTLKANGLVVLDTICEISTRVIANKTSFQFKQSEIQQFIDKMKGAK